MVLTPQQAAIMRAELSDEELQLLLYDWQLWARHNQLPPTDIDWTVWMIMAGRGFGKTRTGVEWVLEQVKTEACGRIALVGPTKDDARDIMVEGESGILAMAPPWNRPMYQPSLRKLTWRNGAIATIYSAEEPDRLRGPQHDGAWCDEVAAWSDPMSWDNLMFGLRLGARPRVVATTTPKPIQLVRDIITREDCVITYGQTDDNIANLAPAFIRTVVKKYRGTRLGRQELKGELLDDVPGALWKAIWIDKNRMKAPPCEMSKIVVAIDPAVTAHEDSDETGIIVIGRGTGEWIDHVFVLADLSGRHPVGSEDNDSWPKIAHQAYKDWHADSLVAERNNGGDLVEHVLKEVDKNVPVSVVWASRGKKQRAEPAALLWEQDRAHMIGLFPEAEDEMTKFQPDDPTADSPNRMEAIVWGCAELMGGDDVIVV